MNIQLLPAGFSQIGKTSQNGTKVFAKPKGICSTQLIGIDKNNIVISNITKYTSKNRPISTHSKFFDKTGKIIRQSIINFLPDKISKDTEIYDAQKHNLPTSVVHTITSILHKNCIKVKKHITHFV